MLIHHHLNFEIGTLANGVKCFKLLDPEPNYLKGRPTDPTFKQLMITATGGDVQLSFNSYSFRRTFENDTGLRLVEIPSSNRVLIQIDEGTPRILKINNSLNITKRAHPHSDRNPLHAVVLDVEHSPIPECGSIYHVDIHIEC